MLRYILAAALTSAPLLAECFDVRVVDPDGLAVGGARVATESRSLGVTDTAGELQVCDVAAGESLRVQASGFAQASVSAAEGLVVALELRERVETPIVVTGTIRPTELAEMDRSLTVLSVEEPEVPAWSFADVLKQDSSMHVRERGPDGTQADLSIRGSTFDQVLVMLNGVRISDAQTGHHSMDLPLPFEAVQQAEVLHGSGSTLYGSDAIGGTVNFVTKKPESNSLKLMGGLGQHGWNRFSASGGYKRGAWTQTGAIARDFSTGFAEGRDFRNLAVSTETFYDSSLGSTSVMFAWNDRPFGANGFYGDWNSWEKTGTTFVSASQTIGRNPSKLTQRFNFAYRRHNDNFILCKPGCVFGGTQFAPEDFQNLHQLDVYQGNYSIGADINDKVRWSAGGQFLSEQIDSTVAGRRGRERGSIFLMLDLRPTRRLTLAAGVREELWKRWRVQTNPTFSAGYRLGKGFKIRAQAASAFRIPTYTDLYHRDPGNVGNPDLVPESAWNYEAGLDWYSSKGTTISAAWFRRLEDNTIDWIRDAGSNVFQARNFQELDFKGGEFEFRQLIGRGSQIWANYTLLRASRKLPDNAVSRYAFNFPRNQATIGYRGVLGKHLLVKTQLGLYNREWQSMRGLWDFSVGRADGRWRPFIQATNLADVSHQAFQGLQQPGRWVRGGVTVQVF